MCQFGQEFASACKVADGSFRRDDNGDRASLLEVNCLQSPKQERLRWRREKIDAIEEYEARKGSRVGLREQPGEGVKRGEPPLPNCRVVCGAFVVQESCQRVLANARFALDGCDAEVAPHDLNLIQQSAHCIADCNQSRFYLGKAIIYGGSEFGCGGILRRHPVPFAGSMEMQSVCTEFIGRTA